MHCPSESPKGSRPRLEVADIVRAHGEVYRDRYPLSAAQSKALWAIEHCRTAALGGHLDVCPRCDYSKPSYNSCRDRHCPKCQGLRQARWIEARKSRILPTPYFHVVFTLPSALRSLARCNRKALFGLLFKAAAETLLAFGDDPKRLGAQLGITAVLHTWSRKIGFHPHLHCVVTGGGLSKDASRWVQGRYRGTYLFPVKALSKLFRGKFIAGLERLYTAGQLRFAGQAAQLADPDAFQRLVHNLYQHSWVVYAKRPFAGPEHCFEYLGRYTHRVAISNHRLVSMDERGVTFRTRGDKTVTLHPLEFIRRFLMHTLPKGFVKIRHYGLLAPGNVNTRLARARALLESNATKTDDVHPRSVNLLDWRELLLMLTGINLSRCPKCGAAPLLRRPLPEIRDLPPRGPPLPSPDCHPTP